ncbi:MAG: hypothetical protein HS128_06955 [Ideonella sp.]|nr:hypothetical protein [Ideonella sp.]MCC7456389.1 hypothetical protein [Nitrospira sp.]
MVNIQIKPDSAPLANRRLHERLLALLTRASAMGVLAGAAVTQIDAAAVQRVLSALHRQGLIGAAPVALAPLLKQGPARLDAATAERMADSVDRLVAVLDDSPAPASEWAPMRTVFGDDALGALVGVAPASLRRYAAGERATPQAAAERLHWLAMVVSDLAGSYNEFGMRRWFERPRSQLGGKSPRALLGPKWTPDAKSAQQIRALAAVLTGAQPLAA